jgi:hypothetical protein
VTGHRLAWLAATLILAGCSRTPALFRGDKAAPPPNADTLYWKAIYHLDAANRQGSLDSATAYLDAYIAAGLGQPRRREAIVLRQLARDSRQLARVQGALQQPRADTTVRVADPESRRRDEEALREIQRLKEELAKANEELERIRKRLAAPKPPASD